MRFFSYQTLLAACHFCSDINQSALAAVLPFLVAAYHYDYATAAMLVWSVSFGDFHPSGRIGKQL